MMQNGGSRHHVSGATAESAHLKPQEASREPCWEQYKSFDTSKPTPNDMSGPASPLFLIFLNSSTRWGPNIQMYDPMEAILIQTTTASMPIPHTDTQTHILHEHVYRHDCVCSCSTFTCRQTYSMNIHTGSHNRHTTTDTSNTHTDTDTQMSAALHPSKHTHISTPFY